MITQTAACLVPFDALKRVAGSRDKTLLRAVSKKCAGLLDDADANRGDECRHSRRTRRCSNANCPLQQAITKAGNSD